MEFYEIAVDKLKEKLTEPQSKTILDEKLLSINLRYQIIPASDGQIQDSPLRTATSDMLTDLTGRPVFWLQTGGLLESDADFSKITSLSGAPVSLGFAAKALVDYQSVRPYVLKGVETVADIVKGTFLELPLDAEKAKELLPGTSFQLLGQGTANFSGTVTLRENLASLSLTAGVKVEGEFALRILREEKNKVSVSVSWLKKRSLSTMFKANVGVEVDAGKIANSIIEHDWYKIAQESVDILETSKITGPVDGWLENSKLVSLFEDAKLEKTIGQYLKNYTSFYLALGTETSYELQHLVKYILDLDDPVAREAYESLCSLDEAKCEELCRENTGAIERIEFRSNETIEQASLESGFPGKKLVMVNTLRSLRDGYLSYDNHMQVMRLATAGKNKKFFNSNEELRWEGLQVQLDNRDTGMDYWRLFYTRNDAVTSKSEIIEFNRFATILGIEAYKESEIVEHSFFKQLISKNDDARFHADIFITEDGIQKIKGSNSEEIRRAYFKVAADLGLIAPGLPGHSRDVRSILRKYDPNHLYADNSEDEREMEMLTQLYHALPVLGGKRRDISQDSRAFHAAEIFRKLCIQPLSSCEESEWGGIFADFGAKHSRDFKQVMASLVVLAGSRNVLVAAIELKRRESGKILLQLKDSDIVKTGEDIFSEAQKKAMAVA